MFFVSSMKDIVEVMRSESVIYSLKCIFYNRY